MPESHGAGALMLGDLGPAPDPHPRRAAGEEDIPHVEADDLGEPEARAQGQGEDHVVPRMRRRYPQQAPPLGFGQDLRGEVGHGGSATSEDAVAADGNQACTRRPS